MFELQDSRKELLSPGVSDMRKSGEVPASDVKSVEEKADALENDLPDQAPTLSIHEKSSLQNGSGRMSSNKELAASEPAELDDRARATNNDEPPVNGEAKSPEVTANKVTGKHSKGNSIGFRSFGFGARNQDGTFEKVGFDNIVVFSQLIYVFLINYMLKISYFLQSHFHSLLIIIICDA